VGYEDGGTVLDALCTNGHDPGDQDDEDGDTGLDALCTNGHDPGDQDDEDGDTGLDALCTNGHDPGDQDDEDGDTLVGAACISSIPCKDHFCCDRKSFGNLVWHLSSHAQDTRRPS